MIRFLFSITFILCSSLAFSQHSSSHLSGIKSILEAEHFIKSNAGLGSKLFTINSGSDTSELCLPLYNRPLLFAFSIGDINYKILRVDSTLSFRVNYIYLNGEQLSKTQIDSLRGEIISKYKAGVGFLDLALQYNMDGNVSGDSRWFIEGMMVKQFEDAVKRHARGDIFTVDTPENKWYHVVLKTYDNTFIKTITLIKAKSKN